MRVLLFGTYDTSLHPRVATMAEGLRAIGAEVAECNAPLGLDTAARVGMLASPRHAPAFLARLGRRWLTLARMARGMPAPDVVLVGCSVPSRPPGRADGQRPAGWVARRAAPRWRLPLG